MASGDIDALVGAGAARDANRELTRTEVWTNWTRRQTRFKRVRHELREESR